MVRILHLATFDAVGGAARATYRLHRGLLGCGVDSRMLVQYKTTNDQTVIPVIEGGLGKALQAFRARLNSLPLLIYPGRERPLFSTQWLPIRLRRRIMQLKPDIIHLHWICGGYLSVPTIGKINLPVVWTLLDMWPFTGGCHYDNGCGRYEEQCGACPRLHSAKAVDLSRWVWWSKSKFWDHLDLTLAPTSRWMQNCARRSSLFRSFPTRVIPLGLDVDRFKPIDKQVARQALNLPLQKKIILFGAISATTDERKGYSILRESLRIIADSGMDDVAVVIFGASAPSSQSENSRLQTLYLGYFHDDISLGLVYSAADVMVVPSLQEAFGQTASEALACGIPVVAFDSTGVSDIVDHLHNGYLARPFDPLDLAQGAMWVLEDDERHQQLARNARRKVTNMFSQEAQAYRYPDLYESILGVKSGIFRKTDLTYE